MIKKITHTSFFTKSGVLLVFVAWLFVSSLCTKELYGAFNYCYTPPFIDTQAKPNVLIILDNSNSMDEDFYGNAVGSFSPASKSVVAKKRSET